MYPTQRWLAIIIGVLFACYCSALPQAANTTSISADDNQHGPENTTDSYTKKIEPEERSIFGLGLIDEPHGPEVHVFDVAHLWLSNLGEAWNEPVKYVHHYASLEDSVSGAYTLVTLNAGSQGKYQVRDFALLMKHLLEVLPETAPIDGSFWKLQRFWIRVAEPAQHRSIGILGFNNLSPRSIQGVANVSSSSNTTSLRPQTEHSVNGVDIRFLGINSTAVADPVDWPTVIVKLHKQDETKLYHKSIIACINAILTRDIWPKNSWEPVPPKGHQYTVTRGRGQTVNTIKAEILETKAPDIELTHWYIDQALRGILASSELRARPQEVFFQAYVFWKGKRSDTPFMNMILYDGTLDPWVGSGGLATNATSSSAVEVFS